MPVICMLIKDVKEEFVSVNVMVKCWKCKNNCIGDVKIQITLGDIMEWITVCGKCGYNWLGMMEKKK